MKYFVVACFVLVGAPIALLGILFLFNTRDLGVRYVSWYRKNWAWTRGIAVLRTPRATRVVAATVGLFWFVIAGGIMAVVIRELLK